MADSSTCTICGEADGSHFPNCPNGKAGISLLPGQEAVFHLKPGAQPDLAAIPELAAQRLQPFRAQPRCPKCGSHGISSRLPHWLQRLRRRVAFIRTVYCTGGSTEPTFTLQTPAGPQIVAVLCAGVGRDHLHRGCTHCGYNWLMETADAGARP